VQVESFVLFSPTCVKPNNVIQIRIIVMVAHDNPMVLGIYALDMQIPLLLRAKIPYTKGIWVLFNKAVILGYLTVYISYDSDIGHLLKFGAKVQVFERENQIFSVKF